MVEIEQQVILTLQRVFDAAGWMGVSALLAFEAATGILPSEVILGLAGWMLLDAHDKPPGMIFVAGFWAALGNLAGTSFTYWLARMGGRPLVDRAAHWLRLDPRYILFTETQFHKWGPGIVLFGRVVPGIRVLVAVPAGLTRMPFPRFLLFSLAGAYLWCTTLVGLGYFLGHEWTQVMRFFLENARQYLPVVLLAFAALALFGWYAQRSIRRRILAREIVMQSDGSE